MNRRTLVVLLCILLLSISLTAQTFRGSLLGTVTDASGAVVPDADVKVVGLDTGLTRTARTNDQGNYSVPELPFGNYSVAVTKAGFQVATIAKVPIAIGAPQRADVVLGTGQVSQTIEVQADVPLIETSSNTTGGTIEACSEGEGKGTEVVLRLPAANAVDTGETSEPASVPGCQQTDIVSDLVAHLIRDPGRSK